MLIPVFEDLIDLLLILIKGGIAATKIAQTTLQKLYKGTQDLFGLTS